MEPPTFSVRAIINLFENNCRKNALSKKLSKSYSGLTNFEQQIDFNSDTIFEIEDQMKSFVKNLQNYTKYNKNRHITHQNELVRLLILTANIDAKQNDHILYKKNQVSECLRKHSEYLNCFLPDTTKNDNVKLVKNDGDTLNEQTPQVQEKLPSVKNLRMFYESKVNQDTVPKPRPSFRPRLNSDRSETRRTYWEYIRQLESLSNGNSPLPSPITNEETPVFFRSNSCSNAMVPKGTTPSWKLRQACRSPSNSTSDNSTHLVISGATLQPTKKETDSEIKSEESTQPIVKLDEEFDADKGDVEIFLSSPIQEIVNGIFYTNGDESSDGDSEYSSSSSSQDTVYSGY